MPDPIISEAYLAELLVRIERLAVAVERWLEHEQRKEAEHLADLEEFLNRDKSDV